MRTEEIILLSGPVQGYLSLVKCQVQFDVPIAVTHGEAIIVRGRVAIVVAIHRFYSITTLDFRFQGISGDSYVETCSAR